MAPHVVRMREERAELCQRLDDLDLFLRSNRVDKLPPEEQLDLREQQWYMDGYRKVLNRRIGRAA